MASINWKSKEALQQEVDEREAQSIRSQRDALLAKSDYTQLPDSDVTNKSEWAQYRKALREITDQPGFPHNVDWPTPPGE